MKELIKITENNGKKAVSARELYSFLGYDEGQYIRWQVNKIENNEFAIENIDYQYFDIDVEMPNGGKRKIYDCG